jgi:hypothetical protein
VDPKNPGAVDEILHLGDFWNEEGMLKNREKILKENKEVGRTFRRAYKYIKAAYSFYEDSAEIISWGIDNAKVNSKANDLIIDLFKDSDALDKEGNIRRLFASAITPNGYVNYLSTLLNTNKVYALKGRPGTGTEKVISKVMDQAVERGYDVEAYYCALNPYKLEHLVIPKLSVALTTTNEYHSYDEKALAQINLDDFIDDEILNKYKSELELNKKEFDSIMDIAIKTVAKAKKVHDRMEAYYIPNMDYEAIQRCFEVTLARIIGLAEEFKL